MNCVSNDVTLSVPVCGGKTGAQLGTKLCLLGSPHLYPQIQPQSVGGDLKNVPHIERSWLRWFGHLKRIFPCLAPCEDLSGTPYWMENYNSQLAWEWLGILQEVLECVVRARESWTGSLEVKGKMNRKQVQLGTNGINVGASS